MIAIVDYGVGNLFSLKSSLAMVGGDACITSDVRTLAQADRLILPGVGAFGDARERLRVCGLDEALCVEAARGKPLLGICLGMQLLFEQSLEFGEHEGLGLIPGRVVPMAPLLPPGLKTPHIGWNVLHKMRTHPLLQGVAEGERVYFVHSYFADDCEASTLAVTEYGAELTAAVARDNVMGCQFHPEKSGEVGLAILRAFCGL